MSSASRQSDPPAKAHRVPSSKKSASANAVEEPPAEVDVAKELQEIDAELAQEADLILDGPINEFASDSNVPDQAASVESAEPTIADKVDEAPEASVTQSSDAADDEDEGDGIKLPAAPEESEAEAVADVASLGEPEEEPATSTPSVETSVAPDAVVAPDEVVVPDAAEDTASEEKPDEPTAEDLPAPQVAPPPEPAVTAKSPPEPVESVDREPQEPNRTVETKSSSADSAWWLPIVQILRAIYRGVPAMGFKSLVLMSYPVRLLPGRAKTIFNWFALSLLLWVPAIWVIAHFLSNRG